MSSTSLCRLVCLKLNKINWGRELASNFPKIEKLLQIEVRAERKPSGRCGRVFLTPNGEVCSLFVDKKPLRKRFQVRLRLFMIDFKVASGR